MSDTNTLIPKELETPDDAVMETARGCHPAQL